MRVAVVNQTFVRQYLNGVNPLGQTLRTHAEPNYPSTVYEIIGTIPDTKYESLRSGYASDGICAGVAISRSSPLDDHHDSK